MDWKTDETLLALLKRGKETGSLTYDEVNAALPEGSPGVPESGPEVVPALTTVIAASGKRPEQLAIISFNADSIAEAKRKLPQHQAYWIVSVKPDKKTGVLSPTVEELIAKAKSIHADGLDLSIPPTADYVKPIKAEGFKLYVWTINDPAIAKKFVELGVDGITTDRAAWLKQQLTP